MVEDSLKRLKELYERERELLVRFPLGEPDEFLALQEEKRELLLELSSHTPEEFEPYRELVEEIARLHEVVRSLLVSNLSFIQELLGEVFPKETYGPSEGSSFFNRKA